MCICARESAFFDQSRLVDNARRPFDDLERSLGGTEFGTDSLIGLATIVISLDRDDGVTLYINTID